MLLEWRTKQSADVRTLQSQLHNVSGIKASGEGTIMPQSSQQRWTWECTRFCWLRSVARRLVPPGSCTEAADKVGTDSPCTPMYTVWQAVGTWCRLLCGQHFINIVLAQCPLWVIRGSLNTVQNGLTGKVHGITISRLEMPAQCLHNLAPASSASSEGRLSSSVNCMESEFPFFGRQCMPASPALGMGHVFFDLRPK